MNRWLHICLLSNGKILGQPHGGEEQYTSSLGKWLANKGHDVTVMGIEFGGLRAKRLSKFSAPDAEAQETKEIEVKTKERKKGRSTFRYFLYSLRLFIWMLQILKILSINLNTPVTLIHAQDTAYTGLAAVISARLLRIPIVVTIHNLRSNLIQFESFKFEIIKRILLKIELNLEVFTIKNASHIILVNQSVMNYCQQITNKKKFDVIPSAIRLKNYQFSEAKREQMRNELGIYNDTKLIGYVGRLSPEKNLVNFLISFTNAAHDDPLVRLVLVGDGPLESELRELVSKKKIEEKVIFCGVRNDIDRILSSLDIFVLPSYTEGLPLVLLEAMTCGKAIVCSDIPANRDLVTHGRDALLANAYDPAAFETAIKSLCNNEPLRIKLGNNAKVRASQYDEDMVYPKILESYKEVISNNGT